MVRAAVCHGFGEPLAIEDVNLAPPGPGEISVRVAACGICHSDLSYMDGAWGGVLPAVYGHEVAGVVTEVGTGVAEPRPGDPVAVTLVRSCGRCFFCAHGALTQCEGVFAIDDPGPLRLADGRPVKQGLRVGGFAEFVTVHSSQAVVLPPDMPLESACLLGCAVVTGAGAVANSAAVGMGASVVVVGAGGVGLNSVQAAALAGAGPIIAVDPSPSRQEAARIFGATHCVASGSAAEVGDLVRSLTRGRGADFSVITSGNRDAISLGISLCRRDGTAVIVGMPATGVTVEIDPGQIADSGLRLVGSKLGACRPQRDIPRLVGLYQQGRLRLDELVSARFPLEEINEAAAAARRGEGIRTVVMP